MADKKPDTSAQDPSTKPVIDLLTAILEEFKQQVQSRTAPPLEGKALIAANAFKEISVALDVKAVGSTLSTALNASD